MTIIDEPTRQRIRDRLNSGIRQGTPEWIALTRCLHTGNPDDAPESLDVGTIEPAGYVQGSPIIGGDGGHRFTDSVVTSAFQPAARLLTRGNR